jgi:hypothetical protein
LRQLQVRGCFGDVPIKLIGTIGTIRQTVGMGVPIMFR